MKKSRIRLSLLSLALVAVLALMAFSLLGRNAAFAASVATTKPIGPTSTVSGPHVKKVTVPMKVVKRGSKSAVHPNGVTYGNCGVIEFFLADNGGGVVDAEEYVNSYTAPIVSLTYSTYVSNWDNGNGQAFGTTVSPNSTDWSNDDFANTGSGYTVGTISADDVLADGTECSGSESDATTIA